MAGFGGFHPAILGVFLLVASPATASLRTGDPRHLRANDVTFPKVFRGRKYTRNLIFTAPRDGKLITDAGPAGVNIIAWGCGVATPTGRVSFLKKDPETGHFTIPARIDNATNLDEYTFPRISMKAGEKVDVRVEIVGQSDCDAATMGIGAGFD
jgi:hypothetical protein